MASSDDPTHPDNWSELDHAYSELVIEVQNEVEAFAERIPMSEKLSAKVAIMTIGVPLYGRVTDDHFRAMKLRDLITAAVEEKNL